MKPSSQNLIWIDLEMTGLDFAKDRILEIAAVITDKRLNVLAEGPDIAIHQTKTFLKRMDDWNVKHHTASGLVERVLQSKINVKQAEEMILEFIKQYVPAGKSPICGNSICQDRRFLYRYMPTLEKYFHYRNLDVSSVKILARSWYAKIIKTSAKRSKHMAMSDIYDSIEELKYYRETIFKN